MTPPTERSDSSGAARGACIIPTVPAARGFESSATAELQPRYEDIAQDGRVQLTTLMPGLAAVWRTLGNTDWLERFRKQRILPILRRIIILGEDGPFSVHVPIHFEGTWRFAREANGERLFLNMWLEAFAPIASTFGRPPTADAKRSLVGRVYAEHVITRPFSPPDERKVTRLDLPGIPAIPEDTHPFEDSEDLIAGRTLIPAGEQRFGMMHTDSNQHVNSLVYPRLFEEAVVRHVAGRDDLRGPSRLARAVELRYRKPFFVDEVAAIALQVDATHHGALAVGAFRPRTGPETAPEMRQKASCTLAMRFS